jgi:hypothetical protein
MNMNMFVKLVFSFVIFFSQNLFSIEDDAIDRAVEFINSNYDDKYSRSEVIRYMKEMQEMDENIFFYGKILDQNGHEVVGAEVTWGTERFDPYYLKKGEYWFIRPVSIRSKSDSSGLFSLLSEKGGILSLIDIKKDGYRFLKSNNRSVFDYRKDIIDSFVPDRNNPIIFYLRKMGDPMYLVERTGSYGFGFTVFVSDNKIPAYDFIQGKKIIDLKNRKSREKDITADLKMAADFNASDKSWRITLSTGTPDGGILMSSELLYEAPVEGYLAECVIEIKQEEQREEDKYIYIKSRRPSIYTRLEIRSISATEEWVSLGIKKSFTNPYGDRNLEQIPDLENISSELHIKLVDEIRKSFSEGRLPEKPDIKLILEKIKLSVP